MKCLHCPRKTTRGYRRRLCRVCFDKPEVRNLYPTHKRSRGTFRDPLPEDFWFCLTKECRNKLAPGGYFCPFCLLDVNIAEKNKRMLAIQARVDAELAKVGL